MISLRIVVLYFIGVTFTSGHVLRNGKLCIHGHDKHFPKIITGTKITPPRIPTFALPFIQQGTNLFYKPQFMASGVDIPPASPLLSWPINPEKPQLITQESQRIPQAPIIAPAQPPQPLEVSPQYPGTIEYAVSELKPAEIPEVPILPPFAMPELPPVIIPVDSDIQVIENKPAPEPRPVEIPEAPVLPSFAMSELPPVIIPITSEIPIDVELHTYPESKPIEIPEAPVLPPYANPELPPFVNHIAFSQEIPECEDEPASDLKPLQIPEAPVLPPYFVPVTSPEIPIHYEVEPAPESTIIEIPEAPALPPFTMPDLPTVIIPITSEIPADIEINPVPETMPIEIPETPVLPPIIAPELQPTPNCDDQPALVYKPIEIPEAPSLPPFSMPELPSIIIPVAPEIQPVDLIPAEKNPECDDQPAPELKPIEIPEAPVLPSFTPDLPPVFIPNTPETEIVPEFKPAEIPTAPVLPPFILPEISGNTVSDCDEPTSEPLVIPEAPKLPPVTEIFKPVEVVRPADSDCPPSEDNAEPEPEFEIKHFEIPPPPQLPSSEIPAINLQITPPIIDYQTLPSIPEAPKLPAFELPHVPTKIIEIEPVHIVDQLQNIPPAPILPEYEVQEVKVGTAISLPQEQLSISTMQPIIVDSNEEPCRDENKPLYQQFIEPTFWAQNIIIDRVLPNMVIGNDKKFAKSFTAGSKYPVITKPYFV